MSPLFVKMSQILGSIELQLSPPSSLASYRNGSRLLVGSLTPSVPNGGAAEFESAAMHWPF